MTKKGKKEIKENKYYKRWHEYSKSEAPDSKPHFFAGYVSSKEDLIKEVGDLVIMLDGMIYLLT